MSKYKGFNVYKNLKLVWKGKDYKTARQEYGKAKKQAETALLLGIDKSGVTATYIYIYVLPIKEGKK